MTKVADFQCKNSDFTRTQSQCHVIHIFFGSSLGKVLLCQFSSLYDMCDRFSGRTVFLLPLSVSSYEKTHPE